MFQTKYDAELHPHRKNSTAPHSACTSNACLPVPRDCTIHVRRLALVVTRNPPDAPVSVNQRFTGCVSGYPCDPELALSTCVERCGCAFDPDSGCYKAAEYSQTASASPLPFKPIIVAPFVPDTSSPIFALRLRVLYKAGECIPHINSPASDCKVASQDGVLELQFPVKGAQQNTPASCAIPLRADSAGLVESGLGQISLHHFNSDDECYPLLHAHYVPTAQHFGLFDDLSRTQPLDGAQRYTVLNATAGVVKSVFIRPLNHAYDAMRNSMQNGFFFARLTKPDRIVNAEVSVYNGHLDAYEVKFEVREPGKYILEVYLGWVYGNQPNREGPLPLVIGPHMGHMFRLCPCRRSSVFGGPFVVHVAPPPAPLQLFGESKCTGAPGEGRWILLKSPPSCEPPICTSSPNGLKLSVGNLGWSGELNPWVWVPYTCYHHLYSCEDIEACATRDNIKWLLIHGDSQVRELMGHMHLLCGYSDVFGKFAALERANYTKDLRLSYYFQDLAYESRVPDHRGVGHPFARGFWQLMHHFNIAPDCASGLPLSKYLVHPKDTNAPSLSVKTIAAEHLDEAEPTRPEVFIFNMAMAYASQDMVLSDFTQWLSDASVYLRRAKLTNQSAPTDEEYSAASGRTVDPVPEQCSLETKETPMRALWYIAPYIFSQAHSHSEHLTSWRSTVYSRLATQRMRNLGISTLDTFSMTQSRWEDSWDGLHYMQSTIEDPGHGIASAMVQQAVLNAVFPTCSTGKE
eukprot:c32543_g1_i1.p1 GENE.c32543_g1_i1~~c32543_g1_i1.p1  ORF type:complete len:745 (+),score=89.81 c32543_g1_i1:1029-3263(+)